jgi:hypothetical protein
VSTSRTVRDGADGAVRVVRALLLAAVALAFSAGAHTAAGGGLPSGVAVLLLGSLTLAITSLLSRRRLSPWTLVPVLIGLQSTLHLAFQAMATPSGTASAATSPGTGASGHEHGHHGHHDLSSLAEPTAGGATTLPWAPTPHEHPAMILAHVTAVVVITVLAVGADRALGRTVGRVARLFGAPARPIVATDGLGVVVPPEVEAAPRTTLWMVAARPHRGPPPVLGAV